MWKRYMVELQVKGKFAAALPKTPEEVQQMLQHRTPTKPPSDFIQLDDLAKQVVEEVGADEPEFGWATFKRNENGLYYEGRCVRGHIKDCALQVARFFPDTKAFKAKVANKVYVETDIIPLGKNEPDGYEQRFIQVMTRQGPRSTIKFIDYIESPIIAFSLRVLEDGVITEEMLRAIFEYGGTHGLGAERSQGWGRYTLVRLEEIK